MNEGVGQGKGGGDSPNCKVQNGESRFWSGGVGRIFNIGSVGGGQQKLDKMKEIGQNCGGKKFSFRRLSGRNVDLTLS